MEEDDMEIIQPGASPIKRNGNCAYWLALLEEPTKPETTSSSGLPLKQPTATRSGHVEHARRTRAIDDQRRGPPREPVILTAQPDLKIATRESSRPKEIAEWYKSFVKTLSNNVALIDDLKADMMAELETSPNLRGLIVPYINYDGALDSEMRKCIIQAIPRTRLGAEMQLFIFVKSDPLDFANDHVLKSRYHAICKELIAMAAPGKLFFDISINNGYLKQLIIDGDEDGALAFIKSNATLNLLQDELDLIRMAIIAGHYRVLDALCASLATIIMDTSKESPYGLRHPTLIQYLRHIYGESADSIFCDLIFLATSLDHTEALLTLRHLLYITTKPANVLISDNAQCLAMYNLAGWLTINATRSRIQPLRTMPYTVGMKYESHLNPTNTTRFVTNLFTQCTLASVEKMLEVFNYGNTKLLPFEIGHPGRASPLDALANNDIYVKYSKLVQSTSDSIGSIHKSQVQQGECAIRMLMSGCDTGSSLVGSADIVAMAISGNTSVTADKADNEYAEDKLRPVRSTPLTTTQTEWLGALRTLSIGTITPELIATIKTTDMDDTDWLSTIFHPANLATMKRLISTQDEIIESSICPLLEAKLPSHVYKFELVPAITCITSRAVLNSKHRRCSGRLATAMMPYFLDVIAHNGMQYGNINLGKTPLELVAEGDLLRFETMMLTSANPLLLVVLVRNADLICKLPTMINNLALANKYPTILHTYLLYEVAYTISLASVWHGYDEGVRIGSAAQWFELSEREMPQVLMRLLFTTNYNQMMVDYPHLWLRARERGLLMDQLGAFNKDFPAFGPDVDPPFYDYFTRSFDPSSPQYKTSRADALQTILVNTVLNVEIEHHRRFIRWQWGDGDDTSRMALAQLATLLVPLMNHKENRQKTINVFVAYQYTLMAAWLKAVTRAAVKDTDIIKEYQTPTSLSRPNRAHSLGNVDVGVMATLAASSIDRERKILMYGLEMAVRAYANAKCVFQSMADNNKTSTIVLQLLSTLVTSKTAKPAYLGALILAAVLPTMSEVLVTSCMTKLSDMKSRGINQKVIDFFIRYISSVYLQHGANGMIRAHANLAKFVETWSIEFPLYEAVVRVHDTVILPASILAFGMYDPVATNAYVNTFYVEKERQQRLHQKVAALAAAKLYPTSSSSDPGVGAAHISGRPAVSSSPATGSVRPTFTPQQVFDVIKAMRIDLTVIPVEDIVRGIIIELEHGTAAGPHNVTDDNLKLTLDIVMAHLRELPDYYSPKHTSPTNTPSLSEWEDEKKLYWPDDSRPQTIGAIINAEYWKRNDIDVEGVLTRIAQTLSQNRV